MKKKLFTLLTVLGLTLTTTLGTSMDVNAGFVEDSIGPMYVDDLTGTMAIDSWVEENGNRYFFGSDGHQLFGIYVYDVDGNTYFVDASTGASYRNCSVLIDGVNAYYDVNTSQYCENTVFPNGMIYNFDANGVIASMSYPDGQQPAESQPAEAQQKETDNTPYTEEELVAMAAQYLPYYVYDAQPVLVSRTFTGFYVEFATGSGNYGVWMGINLYGAMLFGQDVNQFVCEKACFL